MLYDNTREKNVAETPEEHVRQTLLNYLITELNIPSYFIKTEFALSNIILNEKGRLDVIVANKNANSLHEPFLIAECKSGKTNLQHLEAQVSKYLRVIKPLLIILAIGNKWHFLEKKGNKYITITEKQLKKQANSCF